MRAELIKTAFLKIHVLSVFTWCKVVQRLRKIQFIWTQVGVSALQFTVETFANAHLLKI